MASTRKYKGCSTFCSKDDEREREGCLLTKDLSTCKDEVAKKQLEMIMDPFIATTVQPKYPDGKAQWSIGVKYQQATEVRSHQFYIVLFTGVNNWLVAFDHIEVTNTADNEIHKFPRILANHNAKARDHSIEFLDERHPNPAVAGEPKEWLWATERNDNTDIRERHRCLYTAWRPVFCGLRIQPCGNKEEEVGTFDCYRNQVEGALQSMGVAKEPRYDQHLDWEGTTRVRSGNMLPMYHLTKKLEQDRGLYFREMEAHPSFSYNSINSLHNYTFQLNQVRVENDFIPLRNVKMIKRIPGVYDHNPVPIRSWQSYDEDYVWYLRKTKEIGSELMQEEREAADEINFTPDNTNVQINYRTDATVPLATRQTVTSALHTIAIKCDYGAALTTQHPGPTRRNETVNEMTQHIGKDDSLDRTFLSRAFDYIVIRVNSNQHSRFLLHTSYGQEYLVRDDSTLSRFQTKAYDLSKELFAYQEKRKTFHKIPYHYTTNTGMQGIFKDMR